MYKRRRRRTGGMKKGKRKEEESQSIITSTTASPPPPLSLVKVEVSEEEGEIQQLVIVESKAVGARKRKTAPISKIIEKLSPPPQMEIKEEIESDSEDKNNNSPDYKKSRREFKKNGIIQSIVTELKSAKASAKLENYQKFNNKDHDEVHSHSTPSEDEEGGRNGFGKINSINTNSKGPGTGHEHDNGMSNRSKRLFYPGCQMSNGWPVESLEWDREAFESESDHSGTELKRKRESDEDEDEYNFKCGVCSYGSCDKSTLLRHMRTHSGERPFQCRLCLFAFTTKANCERHLRNRHGQIDKDQVRTLVVSLPSTSESESESPLEQNASKEVEIPRNEIREAARHELDHLPSAMNLKISPSIPYQALYSSSSSNDDGPLDLSMDAVDLSTKKQKSSQGQTTTDLCRPRPIYANGQELISRQLLTSPYLVKREPTLHPHLSSLNPFIPRPDLNGLSSQLFQFSHQAQFNPFMVIPPPPPTVSQKFGQLAQMSTNQFMSASPSNSSMSTPEENVQISSDKEETASSKSPPVPQARKPKSAKNPAPGEYAKPKQRRYRTERPFACPHCPARFTLRSNMERHGKHQHPTVWQRSPSNRVINRQKNSLQSPTLVPTKYATSRSLESPSLEDGKNIPRIESNVNIKAVIAQQLKRKLTNTSLKLTDESQDLASVSQLMDGVKTSHFQQYLNGNGNAGGPEEDEDDEDMEEEDGESCGEDDGSDGEDEENGDDHPKNKKSAYLSGTDAPPKGREDYRNLMNQYFS